jgi:hypothetical protein
MVSDYATKSIVLVDFLSTTDIATTIPFSREVAACINTK